MLRLWCSRCDLGITQAGHLHLCCWLSGLEKWLAIGTEEARVNNCKTPSGGTFLYAKQHDAGFS